MAPFSSPAASQTENPVSASQQAFINWVCTVPANHFQLTGVNSNIIGAGHTTSGKNLISTSTITRGGQQVVQASNIDINTPTNGRIRVPLPESPFGPKLSNALLPYDRTVPLDCRDALVPRPGPRSAGAAA